MLINSELGVPKIIKIGIRYHGGYRDCFNKNLNTLSRCFREIRTKVKETNFRTLLLLKVILKLSFKKNYFKTFFLNKVTLLNQFFSNYLCSSRWNGGRFIKRKNCRLINLLINFKKYITYAKLWHRILHI